jgi:hypothetical protein
MEQVINKLDSIIQQNQNTNQRIDEMQEDTNQRFQSANDEINVVNQNTVRLFQLFNEHLNNGNQNNTNLGKVFHLKEWALDQYGNPVNISDWESVPDDFFTICDGISKSREGFKLHCIEGVSPSKLGR